MYLLVDKFDNKVFYANPLSQKKVFAIYISENHGYVTLVCYYVTDVLKLYAALHFSNTVVNVWLGLDTKTTLLRLEQTSCCGLITPLGRYKHSWKYPDMS